MDKIRRESETDRTEAALAASGVSLPLQHGDVQLRVDPRAAESLGGQRLLVLLVNQLARMKGVVGRIYVDAPDSAIREAVPLQATNLHEGLSELVSSLNHPTSEYLAELRIGSAERPAVLARIGQEDGPGLRLGADGWRALLGEAASESEFESPVPFGAGMAATIGASEVFKRLLHVNHGADPGRRLVDDLCFSLLNYGLDRNAAVGPVERSLTLVDWVVAGVGAGGSAALYSLAMLPDLRGRIDLVEPGRHKLSNLNRYPMTTAAQVHAEVGKIDTAENHLVRFAPELELGRHAMAWEQLDHHPWSNIVSTVDTVEARWQVQWRCRHGAQIVDGAVFDLLYSVLRVVPGGWCLLCKHPYDPDLDLKRRAARWGQEHAVIERWTRGNVVITEEMISRLAEVQARPVEYYAKLLAVRFTEAPALTECGEITLRTDVPAQTPVLPIATTAVGVVIAAEIAKAAWCPERQLDNWLGHDLGRSPSRINLHRRLAKLSCPEHPLA